MSETQPINPAIQPPTFQFSLLITLSTFNHNDCAVVPYAYQSSQHPTTIDTNCSNRIPIYLTWPTRRS